MQRNKRLIKILKCFTILITTFFIFIILFFKTNIFEKYRDIWVMTAMSTSNHKYLATWFLSDDEIDTILNKYEVTNEQNSSSDDIIIENIDQNITIEEIDSKTYHGYVVIINNPSTAQVVDTRVGSTGSTLGTTVKKYNAVIAINAGGFSSSKRKSSGGTLDSATIIDGKLLYGDEDTSYSLIGLTEEGILVLGNYTYSEALEAGINDAVSFSPFLIVNGESQIKSTIAGGLQPRTAIGQTKDGKLIFVVIEGREKSSLGATYYDLQQIMLSYDAYNAANLDGGGSSTLYYYGKLINNLSNGEERKIPNAIIVT